MPCVDLVITEFYRAGRNLLPFNLYMLPRNAEWALP